MEEEIKTEIVRDENGHMISYNGKPVQTISINLPDNFETEELAEKIFERIKSNPESFSKSISYIPDFIHYGEIVSLRQAYAIQLTHFSKLTPEKITEATGYKAEEIKKFDKEFWPGIKKNIEKLYGTITNYKDKQYTYIPGNGKSEIEKEFEKDKEYYEELKKWFKE